MRSLEADPCIRELGTQAGLVLQNFEMNHLLQVPLYSVLMIASICAEEPSRSTLSVGSQYALCMAAVDGKKVFYRLPVSGCREQRIIWRAVFNQHVDRQEK